MKTFVAAFLGTLAAFFVICLVPISIAVRSGLPPRIPSGATLVLPVGGVDSDYPPGGFTFDGAAGTSQTELLDQLEKAAADHRISRVLVRLTLFQGGYGKAEELRTAIHQFRRSGKPVIAWTDMMDPKTYAVAVACDSIYMIPNGAFLFPGFRTSREFYKAALDKLGVKVDVERIESYKSAAEAYVRTDMSPASREMATRILADQVAALRIALQAERGITGARFDSLLANPVLLSGDAQRARLIDGVAHYEDLLASYGGNRIRRPKIVSAAEYVDVDRAGLGLAGGKTIAVVHGQGVIASGPSEPNPFLGDVMGSTTLIRELRRVGADKRIAAVVLRLDTPGGETWASDAIGHEVERVAALKPVVVSMSDYCASGGYSIAYRATSLVALPGTLTGSIGSFLTKPNIAGLYEKLGITHDAVQIGPHAGLTSLLQSFTPEEEAMVRARHWESYNNWIADISRVRKMPVAEIDSIGRGRVWTGREALPLKLVDRLGGLDVALVEARTRAGIDSMEKVTIEHYPKRRRPLEALLSGDFDGFMEMLAWRAAGRAIESVKRLAAVGDWSVMEGVAP